MKGLQAALPLGMGRVVHHPPPARAPGPVEAAVQTQMPLQRDSHPPWGPDEVGALGWGSRLGRLRAGRLPHSAMGALRG